MHSTRTQWSPVAPVGAWWCVEHARKKAVCQAEIAERSVRYNQNRGMTQLNNAIAKAGTTSFTHERHIIAFRLPSNDLCHCKKDAVFELTKKHWFSHDLPLTLLKHAIKRYARHIVVFCF